MKTYKHENFCKTRMRIEHDETGNGFLKIYDTENNVIDDHIQITHFIFDSEPFKIRLRPKIPNGMEEQIVLDQQFYFPFHFDEDKFDGLSDPNLEGHPVIFLTVKNMNYTKDNGQPEYFYDFLDFELKIEKEIATNLPLHKG
ncbi:MAG: hypothetical protein IJQ99_10395 [Synergistaceae bacterium]|nr:hypothetical protein [Synergistaceae bacterium]